MADDYAVPVVGALIFDQDDEIFLMQSPKWDGRWVVPGGKIEAGDTMVETVHREVREETGMSVTDVEFFDAKDGDIPDELDREGQFVYLDFVCRVEDPDVELDGREAVDYLWIDPGEALESDLDIVEDTREFVRATLDG